MSERNFYRTVFRIEVLSEEPYEYNGLEQLGVDISTGDCSGKVTEEINEKINGETAARLLLEQGSEPSFFQLDDDGKDIEQF
jgi:hypothetical protein